jgi:hypothetical protein
MTHLVLVDCRYILASHCKLKTGNEKAVEKRAIKKKRTKEEKQKT